MSNGYFRFKQFAIYQDRCAMKVSTDACVQGAWVKIPAGTQRILDIGAGTGLLSLMLAQRSNANIDAVEIDERAAEQAVENIRNSPWADRIHVIHADATSHTFPDKYDLIISNPPFFNNSLLGPTHSRNRARHTITLTYASLFEVMRNNVHINGTVCVLLPMDTLALWDEIIAKHNWYTCNKLFVCPGIGKAPNRVVVISSPTARGYEEEYLHIKQDGTAYTVAFKILLSPFYLHL